MASLSLALTYLVPVALALRREVCGRRWERGILALAGVAALLPAGGALATALGHENSVTGLGLISPLMVFGVVARRRVASLLAPAGPTEQAGLIHAVLAQPSRVLVLSFVGICTIGAFLLALPAASASSDGLSWLDAVSPR